MGNAYSITEISLKTHVVKTLNSLRFNVYTLVKYSFSADLSFIFFTQLLFSCRKVLFPMNAHDAAPRRVV